MDRRRKWWRRAAVALFALAVAGGAAYVFRPLSPEEVAQRERARGAQPATQSNVDAARAARSDQSDGKGKYAVGDTLAATGGGAGAGAWREIEWDALIPRGWDPLAPLKNLKLDELADEDPRAQQALAKALEHWKTAPVEPAMDGAAVRIPGFVVSLGGEGEALREFLLVPYFGACIHVPPPPANQVIHVRLPEPTRDFRTMDPVWVTGVIRIERAETMMGDSGYAMASATVEAYVPPDRAGQGR